jgi:holo-[acyl-carrier protein] synthase
MIVGVGIDMIEVERVRKVAEEHPRFLEKVFTARETDYCLAKKNKYQHLAARFAAKEAFFKALGKRIEWTAVEVVNLASGQPQLEFYGEKDMGFDRSHVSLSHLADYAVAVVVLEKKGS